MGKRGLTDKQEAFARAIGSEGLGPSDAYRKAYDTKAANQSVAVAANKLLSQPNIALRIQILTDARRRDAEEKTDFTVRKLFETYIALAFVDPNELISMRVGACRFCWGEGGGYHWREREFLEETAKHESNPDKYPAPEIGGGFGYSFTREPNSECAECEGEGVSRVVPMDTTKLSPGARLLYRGVQHTKEGPKILFRDQDKALEQAGRILGAFNDKLKIDLDGKLASLKLTTTDPQEAAEAYQKMVDGGVK